MDEIELAKHALEFLGGHVGFEVLKHTVARLSEKLTSMTSNGRVNREFVAIAAELEKEKLVGEVLERAFKREQFEPLFSRLIIESVYAASEERRKMFRSTIVGLAKFDDDKELQSRIARAVMSLEPSDIAVLQFHAQKEIDTIPYLPAELHNSMNLPHLQPKREVSRQALEQAQCLTKIVTAMDIDSRQVTLAPPGMWSVTPVGFALLKHLGIWSG